MKNLHLLIGVAIGLILLGLATLNQIFISLAIPFVLYLVIGFNTLPRNADIKFSREFSTQRTVPGAIVEIHVEVENLGGHLYDLLIMDPLPAGLNCFKGSPQQLIQLKSGEKFSWKYSVKGKRGFYPFDTIQAKFRDSLGINWCSENFSTNGQLMIFPPSVKLKQINIYPRKTRVYCGEIPSRHGGVGVDFFGVRNYQPGDPPAWINWHTSARHPINLFSNEYEQERVADVGIILDGRERSNIKINQKSIFEHSVMVVATLTSAFLSQGNRVGLLHYGKYLQWTFPGYGMVQREKIFRILAELEPGRSLVFEYLRYLPTQIFPMHSQIVLVSPLTNEDPDVLLEIRARGYQVMVISPDPISFECSELLDSPEIQIAARILTLERALLINRLENGGVSVVDWDVSRPFEQAVGLLGKKLKPLKHIKGNSM